MRTYAALAALLAACSAPATSDAGRDAASDRDAAHAGADSGAPRDASTDAGGGSDAGADAARPDAARADASQGSCNPGAVRFEYLATGPLEEGTLCDELFVCARDAAEEARVMAASPVFHCSSEPGSLCGSGRTCAYELGGPGVIDAAELAEICAVTLLTPTPDVVCVVYGP